MAKAKMAVKFEKPPVHVGANGSLSVKASDIFHSQAGQDVILRMTTIETRPPAKTESIPPKKSSE